MLEELTMLQIGITGGFAAFGFVLGGFVLPKLSDMMLKYKYKQVTDYWNDMLAEYKRYKDEGKAFPTRKDKGDAGALRIWMDDQFVQAGLGNLTKDQLAKLREAGFNL